jgi:hypothetical protein
MVVNLELLRRLEQEIADTKARLAANRDNSADSHAARLKELEHTLALVLQQSHGG